MSTNLPEPPAWFNSPGPLSVADLTSAELWAYMRGRRDGYADGAQEGRRQLEHEQEAALTAATSRVIHSVVHDFNYPEHAANRKRIEKQRAAASRQHWADRRAGRTEAV